MSKRAYKERFYPTPEQVILLEQSFGCARFVWNNTLSYRNEKYHQCSQKITHSILEKRLVDLKKEHPWLSGVSSVILQQALRDQKAAFDNFFNPKLSARHPRFKRKYSRQSIRLTKAAFRYKNGEITIAKSKAPLPVRWTRTLPCSPSSITISKDPSGRYFISCLCEFSPKAAPVVPDTTGVEIGLDDLFVTSGGTRLNIDLYTKKREEKLAYLQRQLSKKEKGSNNALKLKKKIARIHAKITDFRRDKIHKATRKLINENQVVCVRLLNEKEFTTGKYPVGRVNSIGWGEFVRQLTYKSEWAGRQIVKVASQPFLFHENSNLIHSARNIKTVGLTGLACGATEVG